MPACGSLQLLVEVTMVLALSEEQLAVRKHAQLEPSDRETLKGPSSAVSRGKERKS